MVKETELSDKFFLCKTKKYQSHFEENIVLFHKLVKNYSFRCSKIKLIPIKSLVNLVYKYILTF